MGSGQSTPDSEIARFVPLDYPNVDLEENSTVVRVVTPINESSIPIVYINQPLTQGLKLLFSIEENNDSPKIANILMTVGLTTCGQSKLREYFYHVNQPCENGALGCNGFTVSQTLWVQLASDCKGHEVVLERTLDTGPIKISHSTPLKKRRPSDLNLRPQMTERLLYPFLILNGIAGKVRVTATREANFLPPTQPRDVNMVRVNSDADSWYLSKGVKALHGQLVRQCQGPHYAVCCEKLTPGQVYTFSIEDIKDSVTTETFTIGYTTGEVASIDVDTLPPPTHLNIEGCRAFNNVLPLVRRGDRIKVYVLTTGLSIESPSNRLFAITRNMPQSAHLFFYMTANIKRTFLSVEHTEREEVSKTSEDEGYCIICLGHKSSHLIAPCSHLCLCADCAANIDRSAGCPACREAITSIIRVFIL